MKRRDKICFEETDVSFGFPRCLAESNDPYVENLVLNLLLRTVISSRWNTLGFL